MTMDDPTFNTQPLDIKIALFSQSLKYTRQDIADLRDIVVRNTQTYISKEEFANLKDRTVLLEKIVGGTIGIISISALGAILSLVFIHH